MAQRISNPAIHHIDKDTGAPLSGGQLFFFEINSTTPKDTFSDEQGTIPNTNPVILDASGVEPDIFGTGSFRVVLQNSNDVQQWERDPVNFEVSGAQFEDWLATVDYGINDIVEGSDSNFYNSFQTPNINNDPTLSPTFWTRFDLLKRWNTNETYIVGDPVTTSNRNYISLTVGNQGNDPTTDAINWQGPRTQTIQTFETAGAPTWTKPAGVTFVVVEVVGGGGGGGSSGPIAFRSGSGGGGGGYGRIIIDVTAIASETVTIGAGGAGGNPNVGVTGGTTSFGAFINAVGGGGGQDFNVDSTGGGAGGTSNGPISIEGGQGDAGIGNISDTGQSSKGGGSVLGMPPNLSTSFVTSFIDAPPFGVGGGGNYTTTTLDRPGGDGSDGICIVTEHYT